MIRRVTGIENKEAELRLWPSGLRRLIVWWIVIKFLVEHFASLFEVQFLQSVGTYLINFML
jgi:hypothetical protein